MKSVAKKISYHVDIQHAQQNPLPISDELLTQWAVLTLKNHRDSAELCIRLVDPPEMTALNYQYRHQKKVTNVLAFPASYPSEVELEYPMMGDVIICPEVLELESKALNTPLEAHWAHIVIHGVLHLLGYDHIEKADAEMMQPLEIALLHELGYDNPYQSEDDNIE